MLLVLFRGAAEEYGRELGKFIFAKSIPSIEIFLSLIEMSFSLISVLISII